MRDMYRVIRPTAFHGSLYKYAKHCVTLQLPFWIQEMADNESRLWSTLNSYYSENSACAKHSFRLQMSEDHGSWLSNLIPMRFARISSATQNWLKKGTRNPHLCSDLITMYIGPPSFHGRRYSNTIIFIIMVDALRVRVRVVAHQYMFDCDRRCGWMSDETLDVVVAWHLVTERRYVKNNQF